MRAVFQPPGSMVSVVLAPRAVNSGSEADAPGVPGVPGDPPVNARDLGGGGEAARHGLAVPAAEHLVCRLRAQPPPGASPADHWPPCTHRIIEY